MLCIEFKKAGVDFDISRHKLVDVQTIYHKKEPRNLSAAYRFYCEKELEDAHSSQADIQATYEVLMAQLDKYDDVPTDIDALSEYTSLAKPGTRNVDISGRLIYDDKNCEIINFGKYKGKLAAEVLKENPGYYEWIQNGDFAPDTKDAFKRIYDSISRK